jgi:hypothetical protein
MRLRQELAAASRATPRNSSYIARLRSEIVALERAMALPLLPPPNAFLPSESGS